MTHGLEPDVWGNAPTRALASGDLKTAAGTAADPAVEDAVELDEPPPQPATTTARGTTTNNANAFLARTIAPKRNERLVPDTALSRPQGSHRVIGRQPPHLACLALIAIPH
jgi:hypothetical protein